ncbi:MAG: protein phosphatase 2C domain-containing protein [Pseudomonas profundi]|uniref:protein phosphatase 2C domain-containing protein n=1 Tax=Pseudomonas profundi TaxID=1981513 RepID=UPI0030026F33
MHIQWTSRQGRRRANNCDAAALAITSSQLIVMLADAAERSDSSQRFAAHWCQTIIRQLSTLDTPLNPDLACTLIQQQQRLLRHDYLLECGSYCLLLLNLENRQGTLLHVGDCLVAAVILGQPPQWLNQAHSSQQQPGVGSNANRHVLTRSLNARRFSHPHQSAVAFAAETELRFYTDGYWAEHISQSQPFDSLDDDASILTIKLVDDGPAKLRLNSDCENFYVDPDTRVSVDKDTP